MRWKAWLADGTLLTSEQQSWSDVPQGVVVLKVWPDIGPKGMYHGHDALWWDGEGEVFQMDLPDPFVELADAEAAAGRLKRGKLIDAGAYAALYEEALAATED